jgi:hypothetical protein
VWNEDPYDGDVVAVFRILAHAWDRCGHHEVPRTITEEPDSPPWWEARWFRVGWSETFLSEGSHLDAASALFPDAATYAAIPYPIDDPAHPHAPRIAADEGFIEVTSKQAVSWQDIVFLGAVLPGCALDRGDTTASCDDDEVITLRHTFEALR